MWCNLVTKSQLIMLLCAWGKSSEKLPTKKKELQIEFTGQYLNRGTIRVTDKKATYGQSLYSITLEHKEL